METTIERDLKTLRTSKLMDVPEFKLMVVVLEKYHKEQTNTKKRNENRELDLRPYLYDDGDTYEKPFYNTLLKMLYEVASFKSHEKQYEDLLKLYGWFKSNQKLLTTDSVNDKRNSEIFNPRISDAQMPRLFLRPRSADGNYYNRGPSDIPAEIVYNREVHSKSALGSREHERLEQNKSNNPLDRISVALKVLPLSVRSARDESSEGMESASTEKNKRNAAVSIPARCTRRNEAVPLPSTFVLKPFSQTTPPVSSPVSSSPVSPVMSPQLISPSLSPRSSPVQRSYSPSKIIPFRQGANLSTEKPLPYRPPERNNGAYFNGVVLIKNSNEPRLADPKLQQDGKEEILCDVANTTSIADEEGDLFESQLNQRFKQETEAKKHEISENLQIKSDLLAEEQRTLQSHLIREHEQYIKSRLNNEENAKHQKPKEQNRVTFSNECDTDRSSGRDIPLPVVNLYDISNHRPVSAVMFRHRGLRVESVIDMVQPVGHQMRYEREMRNRQPGVSIWDTEYALSNKSPVCELHRVHSAPCRAKLASGLHQAKATDNSPRLKQTEPILNPEKKTSDYTVHFPHQCSLEPAVKDFKISGPVSPDTIRYQWTDDGFGNRTYIKKRNPKDIQTSRSSRRSPSPSNIAMTTGERGLDKRTMASLMVIKHLGTANRRDRDYTKFTGNDSSESPYLFDEKEDEAPKTKLNVEYLPFWKQIPSKRGLTILNIPEKSEPPIIECKDTEKKVMTRANESQNPVVATSSPQYAINEMISCLSPRRRLLTKKFDPSTLSVNARAISPTVRPQANKINPPEVKSEFSPAPSRPSSARRVPTSSSPGNENVTLSNFSVKSFSHFCFDDDYELLDDFVRQREIWAAVNIQRIFRGHMARQYTASLKQAQKERQRKAAVALQSTFRGYLARKRLMNENIMNYKPSVRNLQWAREYKEKLKEKEVYRTRRNQEIARKQNRQLEKQQEQIMGVTASDMIHEIFNPPKPTKAQVRAAAITIQRYFRGWFVRKSLKTVKEKALKRTFSFKKFIKSYKDLIFRIQERHNIGNPTTALQFHELQEYVERLFKYEIAFGMVAFNGTLKYEDILKYFAECGHHPSEQEVDSAVALVTKDTPKGRNLNKSEAVEVVFQIYIPKGTGLSLADVRKSTWVNPLINGEDVTKFLSKKDLKFTSLDKCLSLVADSHGDRSEVKELLRAPEPRITNVVNQTKEKENAGGKVTPTSGKQKPRPSFAQTPGGGNFILARAQYHPVKPTESKQRKRRPASGKAPK